MRRISDYKDGDALDLLADIMEPAVEIMADEEVRKTFDKKTRLQGAAIAIKRHKDAVMRILARLEGVEVEQYHCNIFTLPARVLEVLNDKELLDFFTEQAQTMTIDAPSGAATEPTQEAEPAEA